MMTPAKIVRSAIWTLLSCLSVLFLVGCKDGATSVDASTDAAALPKVTMGIQVSPAMTLVMAAKDRGFFRDEGVDVELKEFTAGKFALQAFFGGSLDFAVSGEVPVCLATLQGNSTRIVAQVVERTTNEVRVVALRDGDMSDPRAYFKAKKRKVATSFGGGPEFFTYTFLKHYQIGKDDVEIISQNPADMPAALESRSVDAIAVFDPFAFIGEKRMKDKVATFADPKLYSELYVLNAHQEQIEKQPQVVTAILRALASAATFIEKDPESSKQILQKYTKLDRDVIDGIWPNFVFRPALTRTLFEYWDAEAKWALETGKVPASTKAPDWNRVVDAALLKKVDPKFVTF